MRIATCLGLLCLVAGCAGTFSTVTVDPLSDFPVTAGGVQILGVSVADRNDLKIAQVHLRNHRGDKVVWIKGIWADEQGTSVEDPKETQREVILAAGEEKTVSFTSPSPRAKHLRVQVRTGSR